ncbi:hypothetical protein AB0L97_25345 [Nocardia sp. NPDC051911]|uniref:hypothetical protein n=1 Tax=Nocardia sp. NPDC051911 TaxID=3154648 RepID=UPI003424AFA6
MFRYVLAKLGQAVFVVWGAYTVTFVLLYDAVDLLFDPTQGDLVTEQDKQNAREYYGLDHDLLGQYLNRLFAAARGDFGASTRTGEQVWPLIVSVLPQTALLAACALVLAVLLALAVTLISAYTRVRWLSGLFAALPAAGVSVPVFLVGSAILQVFSFQSRAGERATGKTIRFPGCRRVHR